MTPTTMRAAVIEEAGGPLRVREVPVPEPGSGEVLLKVGGCAVDRFDIAIRNGVRERATTLPHILGHEIAGEVTRLGPNVVGLAEGDRVASSLYLVCGRCRWCLRGRETICEQFGGHIGVNIPGGYAEYVVVPARNLAAIPTRLDFTQASMLANAIGTPYHALVARMSIRPGDRLVVTGAGGGVGLHAIQLGVMLGAAVMAIDLGTEKLNRALALGADEVVDPTEVDLRTAIGEWTDGRGADGVLELVGPATMPATLNGLAKGGRMVIVGSHTGRAWTIDPGDVYRNEWEILGSRNVSIDELRTVIDLVDRGTVTPIIDQTGSLDRAEEFQDRIRAGQVIGRDVLVP